MRLQIREADSLLKRALKQVAGPVYFRNARLLLGRAGTLAFQRSVDIARSLGLLPTPSQPQASPQTQERFLIVNLTPHLGDTIMQMPMIEALRKMHPKARIEFAAEAGAAPLLRMMPILDHVYALKLGHVPPTTPWMATKRTLNVVRRYWQEMRQSAPSVCLMPRWGYDLFRSNMLAYLIRAPRRIGFASDVEVTQQPAHYRNKLLTEPVHGGTGMHEPEKFCLLLVAAGLVPQSAIREAGTHAIPSLKHIADATNWPALAARIGVNTSAPFAVIAPGASMRRRVWPIESWAVVAESLRDQDMQVVLLAGPQDVELTRQLNELTGRRTTLVAGETSLPESVTLISHARLMLGNDSGPGHIAGALGVPSVILFIAEKGCDHDGPSSPERIRPVGPYVAVCRPTHCLPPCILSCEAPDAHCITTILPSEVVRAAQEILQAKDTAEKIETSS